MNQPTDERCHFTRSRICQVTGRIWSVFVEAEEEAFDERAALLEQNKRLLAACKLARDSLTEDRNPGVWHRVDQAIRFCEGGKDGT